MTYIPQRGYERIPQKTPQLWQSVLKLGRVLKVNQAAKTVDIALLDGGGRLYGVPVLSAGGITTMSGVSHLPAPHTSGDDDTLPECGKQRDIVALIGFIGNSLPIVLGFKPQDFNQLSFPTGEGFENQFLFRHESDRYHRIVGGVLEGVPCEEELFWPDGSYFKAYVSDPALTDLAGKNEDADSTPFSAKSDDSPKGYYFRHATGTEFHIKPDGSLELEVKGALTIHSTGDLELKSDTWVTIDAPEIDIQPE